jgi:hypothetical protein
MDIGNWLLGVAAPAIAAFNSLGQEDWRLVRGVLLYFGIVAFFANLVSIMLACWLNDTRDRPSLYPNPYFARRQKILFLAYFFFGLVLMILGHVRLERIFRRSSYEKV